MPVVGKCVGSDRLSLFVGKGFAAEIDSLPDEPFGVMVKVTAPLTAIPDTAKAPEAPAPELIMVSDDSFIEASSAEAA